MCLLIDRADCMYYFIQIKTLGQCIDWVDKLDNLTPMEYLIER